MRTNIRLVLINTLERVFTSSNHFFLTKSLIISCKRHHVFVYIDYIREQKSTGCKHLPIILLLTGCSGRSGITFRGSVLFLD